MLLDKVLKTFWISFCFNSENKCKNGGGLVSKNFFPSQFLGLNSEAKWVSSLHFSVGNWLWYHNQSSEILWLLRLQDVKYVFCFSCFSGIHLFSFFGTTVDTNQWSIHHYYIYVYLSTTCNIITMCLAALPPIPLLATVVLLLNEDCLVAFLIFCFEECVPRSTNGWHSPAELPKEQ